MKVIHVLLAFCWDQIHLQRKAAIEPQCQHNFCPVYKTWRRNYFSFCLLVACPATPLATSEQVLPLEQGSTLSHVTPLAKPEGLLAQSAIPVGGGIA